MSDDCNQPEGEKSKRSECNESTCTKSESLKEKEKRGKRKSILASDVPLDVPKLIDNKRKHLEKRLTSAQRDQKLLEAAKEDTFMRGEMDCFKESSRSTAQGTENMSETMKGLTQGITQGIAILADALTRQPQLTYSPQYQWVLFSNMKKVMCNVQNQNCIKISLQVKLYQ